MDQHETLMTRMVPYWANNLPQTSLRLLLEKRFGKYRIDRAKSELNLVYAMGTNDAMRANLWLDMMSNGELGIFPQGTWWSSRWRGRISGTTGRRKRRRRTTRDM